MLIESGNVGAMVKVEIRHCRNNAGLVIATD